MIEKGHIPEQVWQDLAIFPKDKDANENEVSRDATISQESRQRTKSLTHQYQVDLQQKHYQEIQGNE
jgi:spore coat protein CotH